MKRTWIILCSTLFALSLLLPAAPAAAQPAAASDTLHINTTEPTSIDPPLANYTQDIDVANQLFSGLVRIDPATGQTQPDLASNLAWNASATEVTITLRSGLKWSDGQALDAADVRYSLLRALHPDTNAPYIGSLLAIKGASAYHDGSITDPSTVAIFIDSPLTVRIQFEYSFAFFDKVLSMAVARPVPQQAIEAHPDDWTEPGNIVTSGPYRLTTWNHGDSILLARSATYHGTPAANAFIDIALWMDDAAKVNAYLAGSLDTVTINDTTRAIVAADPVLKDQAFSYATACTFALEYNVDHAPFDDVDVRRAFTAAIDRQAFIDLTIVGAGFPAQTFVTPVVSGYTDGPAKGVGIPSDRTQARAYLTAAGYPDGAGFPAVTIEVQDSARNRLRWDALKNFWLSVLNVSVQINYVDYGPSDQPIVFTGWCADYNDAYNFLGDGVMFLKNVGRLGSWSNATYDALIESAAQEPVESARLPIYQAMEEIITETDAVIAPVYYGREWALTRPYLTRTYGGFVNAWDQWPITRTEEETYTPGAAQEIVSTVDTTTYDLPADLFTEPVTLKHTVLRQSELAEPPSGIAGIGHAFSLTVQAQPTAMLQAETAVPYTVKVAYSPEQLAIGDIAIEGDLSLYAWVDGAWAPQETTVDTEAHTLTATTRQIDTMFMVAGPAWQYLYLPLTMKP